MKEQILHMDSFGYEIRDFKKLLQAHCTLADSSNKYGTFYLEPFNGDVKIWLQTKALDNAAGDTISQLSQIVNGALSETLVFSTDLKNLKSFLHDAETFEIKRNGESSLIWTKISKKGSTVDYTVEYKKGTIPEMGSWFTMLEKIQVQTTPEPETEPEPEEMKPEPEGSVRTPETAGEDLAVVTNIVGTEPFVPKMPKEPDLREPDLEDMGKVPAEKPIPYGAETEPEDLEILNVAEPEQVTEQVTEPETTDSYKCLHCGARFDSMGQVEDHLIEVHQVAAAETVEWVKPVMA